MMHLQFHRSVSSIGTGRIRIMADLTAMQLPEVGLLFVKHNIAYQYAIRYVQLFGLFVEKSAHNRRLLKLFLKRRESLLQLRNLVPQVGDFPFKLHQSFGECGTDARFVHD